MSLHNKTGRLKKWHVTALLGFFNICSITAVYHYYISANNKLGNAAPLLVITTLILILLIDLCIILIYKYRRHNLYGKTNPLTENLTGWNGNEASFSSIFHHSPIGIAITNLDGAMIDVNDIFLGTTGYSRDEIIGKTPLELDLYKNPKDREKFVGALLRDGHIPKMEIDFKMKSGEIKTCYISGEFLKIDQKTFLLSTILDITDQKQTETELRMSQKKLGSTLEQAKMGYWEYDIQSDLFTFNDQFYKMLHTSAEKEGGYTMSSAKYAKRFVHPEFIDIVGREIQKAIKAVNPNFWTELEHRVFFADGKSGTVSVRIHIIKNQRGETIKTYGFNQDITERKKAEEDLRLSENKFSTAFHISPDSVNINRLSGGCYLDINQGFTKIMGYSREEILGKTSLEINIWVNPDDREKLVKGLLIHGEVTNLEAQFRAKSGEIHIGLMSAKKLMINNEECILSITRDISERKQTEEKIRKLSRGVEQSSAAIVITDVNGIIEYVNPKFSEITGYSFDEAAGKKPSILKSGHTTEDEYRELWQTIINKKEWRGNFLNKKKSGELYWESASISSIINNKGEITNFIAVKEDITEMKKITDELIAAKDKAEEMNRIKSYFYANISHELRTPFVGIMGFAEFLKEQLKDPEEREMAEVIFNSSKRLTDTLNKILDITKLEFDKTKINLQKVDVSDLINQVQILYSKTASQHNTEIITNHYVDQIYIQTDENLLQEILSNLVNNAVKYTRDGLIEIITNKINKQNNNFLRIQVKDNGIGIPKEKQDLIWLEFRQASEGFGRSFEGTGLGLSITKKYTKLLNGEVYVESEPGKGSTFTVEFPLIEDMIEAGNAIPEPFNGNTSEQCPVKEKLKVLYVEDDNISRFFINKILSNSYELDEVSNASEALEKIKNNKYSILMVDINLGIGINGIELTQQIRQFKEYKTVPIIAVTAYASANDRKKFLASGFSHYISKPFSSNELLDLLKLL